jgi:c(7)-type cytochrome triheme protein
MTKKGLSPGWAIFGGVTLALVAALASIPGLAIVRPPDVVVMVPKVERKGAPPPGQFSHWAHDRNACHRCHPGEFSSPAVRFDHFDMKDGRYCGSCHDGKQAKAIFKLRCEQCHVP